MSKYEPLRARLSECEGDRVVLSLKEVEEILGRPLPPSARGNHARSWWANSIEHSQSKAWLDAGWEFEELDKRREKVVFLRILSRRSTGKPAPPTKDRSDLEALVDRLSSGARRLVDDHVDAADGDLMSALIGIVENAALERRKSLMLWFADNAPEGASRSADLIREDRDAR